MNSDKDSKSLAAGLYVIATPIGNLGDITLRALEVMEAVDGIACEDTRITAKLMQRFSLKTPLISCHEHNEREVALRIVEKICAGQSIGLLCDAGTPAISDPGFRIVRECRRRGLSVFPVPGPSALTATICAAGLPSNAFLFLGFLPPRSAARVKTLELYRDFPHTVAIYESRHRMGKFLDEIVSLLGEGRTIAVVRELTKLHETWEIGPAFEVRNRVCSSPVKGEFVVLIAPADFLP